jgi:CheY-like chemotaxis protein
VAEGLPRLLGDPMRLKQVLVNLLGNAIKFTSAGYVAISIEREAGPQPRLRVAVSDSGIGIPEARQREVFEAFSQADESITRRYGGTGLGLAISSRLVALMGGALEIKSSVGVGSCFSFTIPIRGESAAAPARSPAFDGKRVLVLEPIELTRTQLRHLVEYLGATCECAADADEALRLLEGAAMQEKPFSLLLAEAGAAGAEPGRLLRGFATPPRLIVMRPMDTRGAPPGDGSVGLVRKPVLDENLVEEAERLSGLREARGPSRAEQLAPLAPDLAVLVAEDHPVNQLLIRRLLEKAGCRVTVANDGREALELVKARPFDVVLMDVQMPEMGGLESTRKIREYQGPLGLATPIVALTAHAHDSDRAICQDAGMNDYLAKPVNPPELYRVLSRFARSGPRPEPEIPAMAPTPSAAPAAADPPPGTAKPHFERAAFEESIGNDPPLFRKLLDLFFEIQPARMDDLAAQLAKGDADAGKRTAHTLVGSFRTMMMPVAGDLAHEIEARLKEGRLDEASESFGRLKPEFAALVGELEAIRAVLPEAEAS